MLVWMFRFRLLGIIWMMFLVRLLLVMWVMLWMVLLWVLSSVSIGLMYSVVGVISVLIRCLLFFSIRLVGCLVWL